MKKYTNTRSVMVTSLIMEAYGLAPEQITYDAMHSFLVHHPEVTRIYEISTDQDDCLNEMEEALYSRLLLDPGFRQEAVAFTAYLEYRYFLNAEERIIAPAVHLRHFVAKQQT